MPQLAQRVVGEGKEVLSEAVMDLTVNYQGMCWTTLIDVTLRSPNAERYSSAARVPNSVMEAARIEKEQRYGPSVWTLAMSPYGRMGDDG